eukprot:4319041-Pleurochrysis_carterae.AAC.1
MCERGRAPPRSRVRMRQREEATRARARARAHGGAGAWGRVRVYVRVRACVRACSSTACCAARRRSRMARSSRSKPLKAEKYEAKGGKRSAGEEKGNEGRGSSETEKRLPMTDASGRKEEGIEPCSGGRGVKTRGEGRLLAADGASRRRWPTRACPAWESPREWRWRRRRTRAR